MKSLKSQLDHWAEIYLKHKELVEFLEYSQNNPSMRNSDLADAFLGVDRSQLEKERRELLSKINVSLKK